MLSPPYPACHHPASSCSFPKRELEEALFFCEREGIRHIVCETNELEIEGFADNPPNRCYICKKALFQNFIKTANENGIENVVEGSNVDDEGDYRPGLKAVAELGIISPLRQCNLTKADIRALSKHLGLYTWEKPSYACLASRIQYGEPITPEKLARVEQAEEFIEKLGFSHIRVRSYGTLARIEVEPSQITLMTQTSTRTKILKRLNELGFYYVTVDLAGFRSGSMNAGLTEKK